MRPRAFFLTLLFLSPCAFAAPPIRVNIDTLPITLDPPILTDTISSWVLHHVGDRLVEEHKGAQLKGNIADKWSISEDKKTYTFSIAKDRHFEDGSPVTAQMVSASFKRASSFAETSRVGAYLKNIKTLSVNKNEEFVVQLRTPTANFLQIISDSSFTIHKVCKNKAGFCFTGSNFLLKTRTAKVIELERRRDNQIFTLIPMSFDEAERRFIAGDLEVLRNYGILDLAHISKLSEQKSVMPDERSYFLAFNSRSRLFSDRVNREQFVKNLDFAALSKTLQSYDLTPSSGLLSPSLMLGGSTLKETAHSPAPAQPTFPPGIRVISIVTHNLTKIIEPLFGPNGPKIIGLSKADFLSEHKKGNFDVIILGYGITVRDWDYLSTLLHSSSSHNFARVINPAIDDLLSKARAEPRPRERFSLYRQVLDINEHESYYIPLFHTPLILTFSKKLKPGFSGEKQSVSTPFISFLEMEIKD